MTAPPGTPGATTMVTPSMNLEPVIPARVTGIPLSTNSDGAGGEGYSNAGQVDRGKKERHVHGEKRF